MLGISSVNPIAEAIWTFEWLNVIRILDNIKPIPDFGAHPSSNHPSVPSACEFDQLLSENF